MEHACDNPVCSAYKTEVSSGTVRHRYDFRPMRLFHLCPICHSAALMVVKGNEPKNARGLVTAEKVYQLRELSGESFTRCKHALSECDGDVTKAAAYLRQS